MATVVATAKLSIIMVSSLETDTIRCHSRYSYLFLVLQAAKQGKITCNIILGSQKLNLQNS